MIDFRPIKPIDKREPKVGSFYGIYIAIAIVIGLAVWVFAAPVEWTRFKGTVKALDQKAKKVTLANKDGDIFTVLVDNDVIVVVGKEERQLKDVGLDDKVTLLRIPKADPPKEQEESFQEMNRGR